NVARWDTVTSQWSPLTGPSGNGANNTVYAVTTVGTSVYVGGAFTQAGGLSANYIALWTPNSWSTGFTNPLNNTVYAMAYDLTATTLFVGGAFTQAGTLTTNYIASCNVSGGTCGWGPLYNGSDNGVNNTV